MSGKHYCRLIVSGEEQDHVGIIGRGQCGEMMSAVAHIVHFCDSDSAF